LDLLLAQIELVREVTERPPYPECAAADVAVRRRPAHLAMGPELVPGACEGGATVGAPASPVAGSPPVHHPWMHGRLLSRGLIAPRGSVGVGSMPHARVRRSADARRVKPEGPGGTPRARH